MNDQNLIFEYTCENNKKLEVVYLTIENNDPQARIQLDNAQYILNIIPSGSGKNIAMKNTLGGLKDRLGS